MENIAFWKDIKEYYEDYYDGILPGEEGTKYALEMSAGAASCLMYGREFDVEEIGKWIYDTIDSLEDDTEIIEIFPNLKKYPEFADEISSFFMWEHLKTFETELEKSNQEYIDIAAELQWTQMIEKIPAVRDIFIF
jgi:hypothetical protein